MALESLTLQDSPLETERLLGAAAFGDTIDMSGFESLYNAPDRPILGFDSLIDDGKPILNASSEFNSLI